MIILQSVVSVINCKGEQTSGLFISIFHSYILLVLIIIVQQSYCCEKDYVGHNDCFRLI